MMKIQKNIPLAPYTTFRIGGAARFFCEVENKEEILGALKFAKEKKLPIFILGGGSNILVSDKGFDGVVVKMQNSNKMLPFKVIYRINNTVIYRAIFPYGLI